MHSVEWVLKIRKELKCGIIDFYALDKAFEVTIKRLVYGEDKEYSLTKHYKFTDLETHSDELLERLISDFKKAHPQFFIKKRKKITGNFDTRERLVEYICDKYHNTPLKQAEIARIVKISETSVKNILDGEEGQEWFNKNKRD